MKDILGGKGANLAEMTSLGLPVPPGFTISTEVCRLFNDQDQQWLEVIKDQVANALKKVETTMGKKFWGPIQPTSRERAIGSKGFHAGHDGHHFKPRSQ